MLAIAIQGREQYGQAIPAAQEALRLNPEATGAIAVLARACVAGGWPEVVHEIADLFISDGSQFTTGGAENPTLTIVTLAIRQADYIADQMAKNSI